MQPVLEVELSTPGDDVSKKVAVEGGVFSNRASRSNVRFVVTSWSKRTWCGAIAAHCFWT
jgi:hypothetical protein